jgi:hypothetical protein
LTQINEELTFVIRVHRRLSAADLSSASGTDGTVPGAHDNAKALIETAGVRFHALDQ